MVEMKEEAAAVETGATVHQAQESTSPSKAPLGTAGVAGWPEHHAPEQRGAGPWTENGSDPRAKSSINGSMSDRSFARSVRDLTRWLHPAQTEAREQKPWTTESKSATVPNRASRLK
jgi:hypothetical protein